MPFPSEVFLFGMTTMPFPSEVFLFGMLIVLALLVAREKNLFAAAMLTGIFSLTSACLFTLMDAVDVAFTEAAVGAGISTVLFLGTLALTSRTERQQPPKLFPFIVVMLTGTALAMGIMSMKPYGDPDAPIHTHVAAKIKQVEWRAVKRSTQHHDATDAKAKKAVHEKAVALPNLVTSILSSYRGYDTLGETGVIFTAGVGVMLLLMGRRRRDGEDDQGELTDPSTDEQADDAPSDDLAPDVAVQPEPPMAPDLPTVEVDVDDIELLNEDEIETIEVAKATPLAEADDNAAASDQVEAHEAEPALSDDSDSEVEADQTAATTDDSASGATNESDAETDDEPSTESTKDKEGDA